MVYNTYILNIYSNLNLTLWVSSHYEYFANCFLKTSYNLLANDIENYGLHCIKFSMWCFMQHILHHSLYPEFTWQEWIFMVWNKKFENKVMLRPKSGYLLFVWPQLWSSMEQNQQPLLFLLYKKNQSRKMLSSFGLHFF